jgi:hypothetical protein
MDTQVNDLYEVRAVSVNADDCPRTAPRRATGQQFGPGQAREVPRAMRMQGQLHSINKPSSTLLVMS